MRLVVYVSPEEYDDYIRNLGAKTVEQVDTFIVETIADYATMYIEEAEVKVIHAQDLCLKGLPVKKEN